MNLYVGKSGQAAVMAEFLIRGYNVATPEVDRGDDLFVVQDDNGALWRIQVESANAREKQGGYSALFKVPVTQLKSPLTPDVVYVFAVRWRDRWSDFLVVPRQELYKLHDTKGVGSVAGDSILFSLAFVEDEVTCDKASFQRFRNRWEQWPVFHHDRTEPDTTTLPTSL